MKYVLKLQEVQERKKFDFVETVSIPPPQKKIKVFLKLVFVIDIEKDIKFFLFFQILAFMYSLFTFYHQGKFYCYLTGPLA